MLRKLFLLIFILVFTTIAPQKASAQTDREAVSAAEVNGTFRSHFSGEYEDSYNEIKILALGKGKLKVGFELIYPYIDGTGEQSANMGEAEGTAEIVGDTATFTNEEFGQCVIVIKFVKPGIVKINQQGSDSECGFGRNVSADGTYKKVSTAKPKFQL